MSEFNSWLTISKLDSAFQLQEHLKALHYRYTKPADSDHTIPINRETANLIATQPDGVDRALWLYELCRFLINKCNDLIIGFLFDDPPCSATTCPEMRASEWQFLCAVHESPKSCCAIDYCCHTLDWATNIVTSQKIFPSRLSLGAGDAMDERGAGVKHLVNIFRRLHRIFAHAWFQHRGVFWQVEGQTGLYVLFKTVCDRYDLLPAENYKLPPEAEGLEPVEEAKSGISSIMKHETSNKHLTSDEEFLNVRSGTNTRRHIRQSPSVGSAVTTVLESDEEDPDVTARLDSLHITEEEEEESGDAEVPVIVESYEVDEHHDIDVGSQGSLLIQTNETPSKAQEKAEPSIGTFLDNDSEEPIEAEPTQEEKPDIPKEADKVQAAASTEPEAPEKEKEGETEPTAEPKEDSKDETKEETKEGTKEKAKEETKEETKEEVQAEEVDPKEDAS